MRWHILSLWLKIGIKCSFSVRLPTPAERVGRRARGSPTIWSHFNPWLRSLRWTLLVFPPAALPREPDWERKGKTLHPDCGQEPGAPTTAAPSYPAHFSLWQTHDYPQFHPQHLRMNKALQPLRPIDISSSSPPPTPPKPTRSYKTL